MIIIWLDSQKLTQNWIKNAKIMLWFFLLLTRYGKWSNCFPPSEMPLNFVLLSRWLTKTAKQLKCCSGSLICERGGEAQTLKHACCLFSACRCLFQLAGGEGKWLQDEAELHSFDEQRQEGRFSKLSRKYLTSWETEGASEHFHAK